MPCQYPAEFRQSAVRLVGEALPDHETGFEAIKKVTSRLGMSPEALRGGGTKSRSMLGCDRG